MSSYVNVICLHVFQLLKIHFCLISYIVQDLESTKFMSHLVLGPDTSKQSAYNMLHSSESLKPHWKIKTSACKKHFTV